MDKQQIAFSIEAILFVAGEAVDFSSLKRHFEITDLELEEAIAFLESETNQKERGVILKRSGALLQLVTNPQYASNVELFLQPVQKQSLSQSALETLVIVAYNQPITKLEVESIRGVKCDYSIQSLIAKNLLKECGRKDTPGRPILYGTTDAFLSHFGFRSLNDLPPVHEITGENEEDSDTLTP